MANQILRDCKLYADKYDFSGSMNALALTVGVDLKDDTAFGDTNKSNAPGLKNSSFSHEGYYESGTGLVDPVFFANLGLADKPMTISPTAAASGDVAYFFNSIQGKYAPGGKLGDMFNFTVDGNTTSDIVRGTIMNNATRTTSGTGTAYQLGALTSLQKLYAALHVITVSGTTPTLVVKVQSDDAEAFSTPTDRITFASQNAANALWATPVAGAITDTWWRVTWTLTGTTPSFQFVIPAGIL